MALKPILSPFIFGEGGQKLTPEQVAEKRKFADELWAKGNPAFNNAGWLGALGRGLEGAYSGWEGRQANKAEEAGDAEAIAWRQKLNGINPAQEVMSLLGGQDSAPGAAPIGPHSSDPRRNVSAALAGSGAASGQNFPMSLVQSESGGNWNALNSEGYGGRLQFGKDRLADAARAGVIPTGMTGAQFSQLPRNSSKRSSSGISRISTAKRSAWG